MLFFNMSPDPDDRSVRWFDAPLCPRVLVVGDFFERPDNRAVDDRNSGYVDRHDLDKFARTYKLTGELWQSLRRFVQDAPEEACIDGVNASIADLIENFEDVATPSQSGFYKFVNPHNHQGMRPYSLVVVLDAVNGDLLRHIATIGRMKNVPVLVEKAGVMTRTDPAAQFVVPCPRGAIATALETLQYLAGKTSAPSVLSCAGTTLSSLVLLTHVAQQVLHIDYHRGTPSRDRDAEAMTNILNGGLSTRLSHLPGVSARLADFVWKNRPTAEATLWVTTPELSVEDRIVLQFEYA